MISIFQLDAEQSTACDVNRKATLAMNTEIRPRIIGLTGRAGTGKDTAADYLYDAHGYISHAFAAPLREMVEMLLSSAGIDAPHYFQRHMKERDIPGLEAGSVRTLMQSLGTQWGRDAVARDLWVRHAAISLGLPHLHASWADHRETPVADRIVFTDVRFLNEAEWIVGIGGTIVRINRNVPALPGRAGQHISETEVDNVPAKYYVDNTGSIDHLHKQLDLIEGHFEESGS